MSLHPGESGYCVIHGQYDEYCGACADIQTGAKKIIVGHPREYDGIQNLPCTEPYSMSPDFDIPMTLCDDTKQHSLAEEVARELTRAQSLFPPIHSPHEGLAVIEEEWEEFKKEVWAFNLNKGSDTRRKMRTELVQLAAMCLRTIHDTIDKEGQ